MAVDRKPNGRFAQGNAGGPGRPRRPIEQDYLAIISAVCPPETWQTIVERAVADALDGNGWARAWLAGFLIGKPQPPATSLHQIAVDELLDRDGLKADAEIAARSHLLDDLLYSI